MTAITLAEELLLLGYDDVSGKATTSQIGLDLGMAAAVLVDLALARRIGLADGGLLTIRDATPTGDPIADEALVRIAADTPHTASSWVQRLRHGLRGRVLADLVSRGVVRELDETAMQFIHLHRYPVTDPAPEADTRARLTAALTNQGVPDERTAALAALVAAVRMEPTLRLTGDDLAAAHQRLEEIAGNAGFGGGVRMEDSMVRPSVAFVIVELVRAIGTALGKGAGTRKA
jgi:hypothetical protein